MDSNLLHRATCSRITRQLIRAAAVCIAALLACGYGEIAAAQDVPDETALINVIKSDAGWLEKQAACRSLRLKGTAASVPALAALLPDEKLSHMARYALESMPYPEAGQALRDALGKTQGSPKAGVIISIGVRRDPEAALLLVPLLKDSSADIARAAAGALGRIATPEAVQALMDSGKRAPEALRPALSEGLLAAGQRLTQEGKGESAAPIYQKLLASSWPMRVRMGAFHGLAYAKPNETAKRLIDALRGRELVFRDMASQIVAETSGADTTKLYTDALPKLAAGGKVALLRGLAGRGDITARPAVAQSLLSSDKGVKLAAVKALGVLGNAEDVAALTGLLASDDSEIAKAANASLTTLQGADINPAIAAALPAVPPGVRAQLLDLLLTRRADQAMPLAVNAINDSDATVRTAGLRVLTSLGGKEQVPGVLQVLAKTSDAGERSAAEKALGAMCSRAGEETLPLVLEAMNGAALESRIALLHVVARIGGPKALDTALAALNEANAQISDEAVRMISDWPTLDAVPHLLKLAQGEDITRQVLGLRGYVRLAGIEPSTEERARMLTTAMALTKRPDEKKLVLGAYGTLPTQQSLDALRPHLDDAAVQNEAALAIIAVATELAKNPNTNPQAIEALKAVAEKAAAPNIRERAQKALAGLQ